MSFPPEINLPSLQKGNRLNIILEFIGKNEEAIKLGATSSIVTGIPILVKDGHNIQSKFSTNSSGFNQNPHARTAIGLKAGGTVVVAVAEHAYKYSVKDLKLQQVKELLNEETNIDMKTLTLPQALTILERRVTRQETIGLTIPELAELMVDLGCESAINLDGGGSSTMFIGNRIVNETTGDQDEALGRNVARPISDSIVIIPKR